MRDTKSFRHDLKRESRGRYADTLETDLLFVIKLLAENKPLKVQWRDHVLTGQWWNRRDCHIKPDLVLIYQKPDNNIRTFTAWFTFWAAFMTIF